jgi:hypothetical protein
MVHMDTRTTKKLNRSINYGLHPKTPNIFDCLFYEKCLKKRRKGHEEAGQMVDLKSKLEMTHLRGQKPEEMFKLSFPWLAREFSG